MSTELPNQPDEPANRPPAGEFPPPLPRQAEAVDWGPPPWANRPAAEPPSDPGSIAGWTPPPWTAGSAAVNRSVWVIKARFPDGASLYWCGSYSGHSWRSDRGSAMRYGSEFKATTQAYKLSAPAGVSTVAVEVLRIKITIVYESMFGNTHKVAQAISDGVREAHPDAQVECVAVGRASAELIKSTDLLIVGGPTHLRHMTTNFSRKRQISREKKAEAKGRPPRELEPDAAGPGLREWFYQLPQTKKWGHAAAFDTRLGSALAGGAGYGIARKLRRHGYVVRNAEGFILDEVYGPLHAGEIERAKEWGAQVVPEGWAIWDRLNVVGNE
jgi:hypothetical protein